MSLESEVWDTSDFAFWSVWDDWAESARKIFKAMRSPAGEEIILDKNVFIERILPSSIIRNLSGEEMQELEDFLKGETGSTDS